MVEGESPSPGSDADLETPKVHASWIWDQLGQKKAAKAETASILSDLGDIDSSDAPESVKGFFRFESMVGPEKSMTQPLATGPAAEMLQERHASALEMYESVKKEGGEKLSVAAERVLEVAAMDEILQASQGKDVNQESNLPGFPDPFEAIMVDRIYRGAKKTHSAEQAITQIPEYGQAKEWGDLNQDGQYKNAPPYFQPVLDQAYSRTDRQILVQKEAGRLANALNDAWHKGVNPKTSAMNGAIVGEVARKLNGLQVPHAFDDAPLLKKLGMELGTGAMQFIMDRSYMTTDLGMNAFYSSAKITRDLFAPDMALPDWIEDRYSVGVLEMAPVLTRALGLESIPWDEESKQFVNRDMVDHAVSESLWLTCCRAGGQLSGFVASPGIAMTKFASLGVAASMATTKGLAWITGSKVAPQYQRLTALLGQTVGVSAFTGLHQAIMSGGKKAIDNAGQEELEQSFQSAFMNGSVLGPLYVMAGQMGGKAGDLLLRAKAPRVLARSVQGAVEGLGFASLHDGAVQSVWDVLRDPSRKTWDAMWDIYAPDAIVMSLFGAVHKNPQKRMRDEILREHGVDIQSHKFEELKQKAKEQTRDRGAVVEAYESGKVTDPQAPWTELMFQKPTQRERYQEAVRQMGERGRHEAELEKKTGVATEHLVRPRGAPMSEVFGPKESPAKRIARDAPLRLLEWNKERQLKEGPAKDKEFGSFVVFGKEGVEDVQFQRAEAGVRLKTPMKKLWDAVNSGKKAASWHSHPNDAFFSDAESDLGVFRGMRKAYEAHTPQAKEARVPFVVVGTDRFLVVTKEPGKLLPSKEQIQDVFDSARKLDLSPRNEATAMAQHPGWKEIGLEMQIHSPREFQVLWRRYVDGDPWLPKAEYVKEYAEEVTKREKVIADVPEPRLEPQEGLSKVLREQREGREAKERARFGERVIPELPRKPERGSLEDVLAEAKRKLSPEQFEVARERIENRYKEANEPGFVAQTRLATEHQTAREKFLQEQRAEMLSEMEKAELAAEPDVEGFTRTASEIAGKEFQPTVEGAREAQRELEVKRPELTGDEHGTYHSEPSALEAPGRPPLKGKFEPGQLRTAEQKLKALFHRAKVDVPAKLNEITGQVSTYFKDVFKGRRNLMADVKAGRLSAAEAIEKMGYRSRFRKLGEYEDRMVAETDRLTNEIGQASRVAGQRLMDALTPITKMGTGKDALEVRQKAVQDVLQYMYLKDFEASAKRKEPLPLELAPEEVTAKREAMEDSLTPEMRKTIQNIRGILDHARDQLIDRGALSKEKIREDYMPHKVVDFFDAFSSLTPGRTVSRLRQASSGYQKARKGSARMIDTSQEALASYLTQVQKDNAIHDFIVRNGATIHGDMMEALQVNGIQTDFQSMNAAQWKDARQDLAERGIVVYDARFGELGKHNLTQDPVAQEIYRFFSDKGAMQMPEIAELGKNLKPNPDKFVYMVPKEVSDLWLDLRAPRKSILASPFFAQIRKTVGSWYKGPALRGFFGLATIPRQGRNLISDTGSIAFKKSVGEAVSILSKLPEGHRFARALTSPEWRGKNLAPHEEALLQEMELYGSVSGGETTEALGHEGTRFGDHPTFKAIYGDFDKWWNLKKHYQADYRWTRTVDTYSENLFRAATWLHERTKLIEQGQSAQDAARGAHLETGRILVNYKHNTPLEANVLNTLAFPFYTWTRHQITSTLAEGLRRPLPMIAKYGVIQTAMAAWNAAFAQDEESKLIQTGHRSATLPHVWMPWIKDSEGNPFVATFEMPTDMVARFFGLGGAGSKLGDYLFSHGDENILWRDLAGGGLEESALTGGRFLQDWMAPWLRAAGGWLGFKSKFVYPGELAGAQIEKGVTVFRPVADVARLLSDRNTMAQKVSTFLPVGRFVDLSEGVPAEKRQLEFYAGRQQRYHAKLTQDIHAQLHKVSSAMKAGNMDKARKIVDSVWDDWADELSPLGYTQTHLANRFWNQLQGLWRKELQNRQPGPAGARFHSLSEQQQIQALREMGYIK